MAPNWRPEEIAQACRAYANATDNGIVGSDQDLEKFSADIVEKLKVLSPSDVRPGTYYERGVRIYPYLRDNVFPEIQKFSKAMRLVEASGPSGVTDDQKVNMSVAIFLKKTDRMDYTFKDFDASSWRLYGAWKVLKNLPKFIMNPGAIPSCDQTSAGGLPTSSAGGDSDSPPISEVSFGTRGGGKGRDASKKQEHLKVEREKRKREQFEERKVQIDLLLGCMNDLKGAMHKKMRGSLLKKALAVADREEDKKRIRQELLDLALEQNVVL